MRTIRRRRIEEVLATYQKGPDLHRARCALSERPTSRRSPSCTELLDVSARDGAGALRKPYSRNTICSYRSGYEAELEPLCQETRAIASSPIIHSRAASCPAIKNRSPGRLYKSPRGERVVSKYLNDRGRAILAALDRVAAQHHCHADAGRIGLGDGPSQRHRPDRQRHQCGATYDFAGAAKLKLDQASISRLDEASGG